MRVIQIDEGEGAKRWDAYVGPRAIAGTDLFAWRRVVTSTYGLRPWFFAALEGDRVAGTLGLFEARHPIFGHYLATAPFGNDGGFHFDGGAARDALLVEARKLADDLRVDYLVVRTRGVELEGFHVDRRYQTALIDLEGGAEAVWNKRLDAKTRNQVRKAMKEGFTVETGHAQMGGFLDVFHRHMRDLGSPAHGARYYAAIVEHFGEHANFFVVRDGREPAAGALVFWINGVAVDHHTVALRKFNRRCPNYLIYWKMLEASCERKCTWFDMGRSEAGSSNIKFKLNWGPELRVLPYNYYLVRAKSVPYLDPRNPRYRIPILLWQRLPLFFTRRMGPRLISGLL
jgi:FemAB-related protein (PEP-CTERM system-associated)